MVDGLSRIQRLLQEQQWERSLSTSEEAIGDAHDDSPLSATVEGYSGGRVLLRFPGASNPIPGGRMLTSGAIGKGESVLIDQSPSAILDIEGMPWRRPPEEEQPEEPEIITNVVVHLFVVSECLQDNLQDLSTGRHHYWLVSGENALKVFETNTYEPIGGGSVNNPTDRIIPAFLPPDSGNGDMLVSPILWILSPTKFIVQIFTQDYSNVNLPSYPENKKKDQIYTAVVENWAIAIEHFQTRVVNTPVVVAPTYPPELEQYLDWLTPTWGGGFGTPVVDQVVANYPGFDFNPGRCNISEQRIPTRCRYVFRPTDVMGGSGSYLNLTTGETYTTGTPFYGNTSGPYFNGHGRDPLELNAIAREWQIETPTETITTEVPETAYRLIGGNYHTFTDTQPLFTDSLGLFYIPQLRDGSFDAENELSGYFVVVQGELSGYPAYLTYLQWITAKGV